MPFPRFFSFLSLSLSLDYFSSKKKNQSLLIRRGREEGRVDALEPVRLRPVFELELGPALGLLGGAAQGRPLAVEQKDVPDRRDREKEKKTC